MASKSFGCVQETKQKVAPKWPGNDQLWTPSIVFQKKHQTGRSKVSTVFLHHLGFYVCNGIKIVWLWFDKPS